MSKSCELNYVDLNQNDKQTTWKVNVNNNDDPPCQHFNNFKLGLDTTYQSRPQLSKLKLNLKAARLPFVVLK